tara:strand:+ start:69 stop:305 length:237 start_codon:yes stop_codon:yes gene_type:complete
MNNKFDINEYYKTYVTTEKVTNNIINYHYKNRKNKNENKYKNEYKNENKCKETIEAKTTRSIATQTDISLLSTDIENQ